MYIFDIILAVIFVLVIFSSFKKGFFRSLFDLIGSFIAFFLARLFSNQLAESFYENFIQTPARNTLTESLGTVGTTDYGAQVEQAINSIPDTYNGLMNIIGIDKQELLSQVSQSSLSNGTVVDNLMNNVVRPVGTAVVQFLLFVVLAIVFVIGIKIAVKLLDFIIKKIPVVKQLNKSLGVVVGIFRGIIVVVIISAVISLIPASDGLLELIEQSYIIKMSQDLISAISGAVIN